MKKKTTTLAPDQSRLAAAHGRLVAAQAEVRAARKQYRQAENAEMLANKAKPEFAIGDILIDTFEYEVCSCAMLVTEIRYLNTDGKVAYPQYHGFLITKTRAYAVRETFSLWATHDRRLRKIGTIRDLTPSPAIERELAALDKKLAALKRKSEK